MTKPCQVLYVLSQQIKLEKVLWNTMHPCIPSKSSSIWFLFKRFGSFIFRKCKVQISREIGLHSNEISNIQVTLNGQTIGGLHHKTYTLEYQINVQQILFKFWVLVHLHAYFVLHNSKEKRTWCRICFLLPIY